MTFGIVDIATLLLVTVGPLKALIVFATLTARADAGLVREHEARQAEVSHGGPGREDRGHDRRHPCAVLI